jgi:hypothetical protein
MSGAAKAKKAEQLPDDPVLRAVLTAPVEAIPPPDDEAEAIRQAKAGPWLDGSELSAQIDARARRR